MALKIGLLYEAARLELDLDVLLSRLGLGLQLEHPIRGEIVRWMDDGTEQYVTREQMRASVLGGERVYSQFWYPDGDDVGCDIRLVGNVRAVEFQMHGHTLEQGKRLQRALRHYFMTRVYESVGLGFVCDDEANTEKYSWDDFFNRSRILERHNLYGLPEILLLEKS